MKIYKWNSSLLQSLALMCVIAIGIFVAPKVNAQPSAEQSSTGAAASPASTIQDKSNEVLKIIAVPSSMPKPIPLGISLMVNSIDAIEDREEQFIADFFVFYTWKDVSLAFDPKKIGSVRKEYNNEVATRKIHEIWSPHIMITNLVGKPQQVTRGLKIYSDGTIIYSQHIVGTFAAKFNFNSFPFDSQVLPLIFKSTRYDTEQLNFYQNQEDIDRSGIDNDATIKNWSIKDIKFTMSEDRSWDGNLLPVFEAKTEVARNASSEYFALLPLFLTMFMPIMNTLFLKSDVGPRLTAWSGALLATIMLNAGFDSKYQFLDSTSLAKELITFSLGFQFLMMVLTMTVFNEGVMNKFQKPHLVAEINRFLRWAIPFCFILLIVSLVLLNVFG
jgi:hypothetical protein